MANNVEQYGLRKNIRIRGLPLCNNSQWQAAVVAFLNENLQANITSEEADGARILPTS